MYLRIHETPQGRIVALCDTDLIGKVFREGKRVLDLDRYRGFYTGKQVTPKEAQRALGDFFSVNAVGSHATELVIRAKLARPADVAHIQSIPHIQVYRIGEVHL